jgi:hypothetical protein
MTPDERKHDATASRDEAFELVMAEIVRSVRNVRFGSVEITIHDSQVVQIERKEKVRLAPSARPRGG